MISFGFIKEYDPTVLNANSISNLKQDCKNMFNPKLISYLRSGKNLISMMHWVKDAYTNELIMPHIIRTDGFAIWPDYATYFINLGFCVDVPKSFLENIEKNKFAIPEFNENQMKAMVEYYFIIANIKSRKL